MIQIPENTYVDHSEVREDVVERIAISLLAGCDLTTNAWFASNTDKWISPIPENIGNKKIYRFISDSFKNEQAFKERYENYIRMRSCEVKKALEILKEKKYFVWISSRNEWFWVTRKPKTEYGRLATQQDIDAIDID